MASKQMQKEKKKRLKLKQKEITLKNKELNKNKEDKTELLDLNKEELPEVEDVIELTGPRGYVLKVLKDMVQDMNSGSVPDNEIQILAEVLIKLAQKPTDTYTQILKARKIKRNNKVLNLKNKINTNLNTTERAFLKNRMQGILMEYGWKNSGERIDYSGIRLYFEMAYRLILAGLEEKKIRWIDMSVGYGDSIYELKVNYRDDGSQYNIHEMNYIQVYFNALDNLYNTYAIYKNKYSGFSECSLNSLATASDMYEKYISREEGKEIVSYNGIVLNYVGVLEFELKKLMALKFKLNEKRLKLVDAINSLSKLNHPYLSTPEVIEDLHKVRLLRNKVAHGNSITYDECSYVRTTLVVNSILDEISREITLIKLGI